MKKENRLIFFIILMLYTCILPYGFILSGLLVKYYYPDNLRYIDLISYGILSLIPEVIALVIYIIRRILDTSKKREDKYECYIDEIMEDSSRY